MALTPEQTVAMAIEADCTRVYMHWDGAMAVERMSRFAALVAAKEREACAQVCEGFKQGNSATYIDDDWADMCAAAIRARKE